MTILQFSRPAFLSLALLLAGAATAPAQDWPARQPIKIVVPFTPGSATDLVARAVFDQVSRQINQAVLVENRAGGGTTIGSATVAKAEPDGYTLLVNSTSHVVVATTFPKLPYSVTDDFIALSALAAQPFVITTRTKYKTIADLVQFGRANPGVLNYGSNGIGTSGMLFMEKFALVAKMKMTHVPFRGTPEAMTEIIADRLDMFPGPVPSTLELAKDGKVNALAVSTPQRSNSMPGVPTLSEAGLPGADYIFWVGAFAPAKTPRPIAERIHAEIIKALNSPEVKRKIAGLGADPMPMSMADFDAFIKKEIKLNADIFVAAGIKLQ
jgi:tripartite-type tricarboxylate transporter receptor subunit TctC